MRPQHPIFAEVRRMPQRTFSPTTRLSTVLCGLLMASVAVAQQSRFDIWKGNDLVGSILAKRIMDEDRTHYLMTSFSEFDIIWRQQVSSLVSTEYRNGEVAWCHASMKVNGSLQDSSHFVLNDHAAQCFVHPDDRFLHEAPVRWTTARMYFEEPVGQRSIFVESVMKPCPLTYLGNGRYKLVLPDEKVNLYDYRDGRLEEIHVDRNLVDLIFRRDS